jgi:ankyrin repeat protein
MMACARDHNDAAELLVLAGADLHSRNNQGMTAIDLAQSMQVRQMLAKAFVSSGPTS